ncbi:MAG: Hsp20/alpha crystallin family protein [Planctomycetota bacterium]|jgi:HSP20 family molecular chaperone IbpA|nr:Hsp20/alpha crystallin family protein [Planctomycetota bacterium]
MDTAKTYDMKESPSSKEEVAMPEGVERFGSRKAFVPPVDIVDNGKQTVLIADMPGVDQDSIEVMIEKNVLTIKGKPQPIEFQGLQLVYSEYAEGDFERSFTVTEDVDRDNITANIKEGVLTVVIPKARPAARRIAVGQSDAG